MQARRRNILVLLHRYTGLILALYLVLVGLTGSVIAFKEEIDGWLNPQWQGLPDGNAVASRLPVDQLVAVAERQQPAGRVAFFYAAREDSGVARAFLVPREEGAQIAPDLVFIDAATGAVIGERTMAHALGLGREDIVPTLFRLHRNLLLGDLGKTVTGVLGLIWLAMLIIGIVLAWPKKGKGWKAALGVKRGAGSFRVMYDLHRAVGLVAGVLLMLLALTGAILNLPDVARPAVGAVSALSPPPASRNPKVLSAGWQQAIDAARATHPQASLFGAAFNPAQNLYQVRLHKPNDLQHSGTLRVFVDASDGKVVRSHDPLSGTGGDAFIGLQYALHSGQILGLPGQALMAFAGLLPLLFAVTGIAIWLQKRRSAAVRHARSMQPLRA